MPCLPYPGSAPVLHIAPIITEKHKQETRPFHAYILIGLGIRVAFKTRMLAFFWDKIFHGNKDLFSEPSMELETDEEMQVAAETLPSETKSGKIDDETETVNLFVIP